MASENARSSGRRGGVTLLEAVTAAARVRASGEADFRATLALARKGGASWAAIGEAAGGLTAEGVRYLVLGDPRKRKEKQR